MSIAKAVVVLCVLYCCNNFAVAKDIDVSVNPNTYSIGKSLQYYKDTTGRFRAENIINDKNIVWKKVDSEIPSYGFDSSSFWFLFSVSNSSSHSIERIFTISYPLLDQIDFYAYSENQLIKQFRSGDNLIFNNRPINSRFFGFPLKIPPNKKITILLNMKTEGAAQLPLDILEPSKFYENCQKGLILEIIFLGAMLGVAAYNLMLFISIREGNYSTLYYIGYVLSYSLMHMTFRGIGYQWLWPDFVGKNESLLFFFICGVMIFSLLFSIDFLDLKKSRTWVYDALSLALVLAVAALFSSFLLSYSVKIQLIVILVVISSVIMFYAGIIQWFKGNQAAKIYSIAWAVFWGGALLIGLNKFGVIPRTFITEYATQIGTTLVAFLLSLALAQRINSTRRKNFELQKIALEHETNAREANEKALSIQLQANDELEERVKSRTKDLEKALNELSLANVELNNLRTIDSLTQINNRTFFDETIYKEWKRASRSDLSLSLMMIDVDHFKPINDTYGHLAGDEVLKQIAQIISLTVKRPSDTLARYGGEEFSIILPHTEFEGAMILAERIRIVCEQSQLVAHNATLSVTISIGVSAVQNFDTSNFEIADLIDSADQALYQSKKNGRNQVTGHILGKESDS